jgi:hypothetical protein
MPARIAQNFSQVKCLGCLSLGGPMGPGARQPASWSLVGGGGRVAARAEHSVIQRGSEGTGCRHNSGTHGHTRIALGAVDTRFAKGRRFASHSDKLGHSLTKHAIQLRRASLI